MQSSYTPVVRGVELLSIYFAVINFVKIITAAAAAGLSAVIIVHARLLDLLLFPDSALRR